MRRLVLAVLIFYQKYLSPLKPPSCRFYPTCSDYAVQAVRRYGAGRGLLLAVWRLLRCQPFCRGGYDPVK
ncbi:membrane protein insertion efficiency factor YidD [Desulfotomaculum copahuensis]|uniref:Putative membrane protein insertion efficiency factor n=1 Tax=Desulfotomaculum copahuensis TaxID=1838280 RepID=A0A1B7LBG3_9FIRM|nr:membrane protein insertion efficiency factor YidD [Desulfotomaculum copahuensis]OAT79885.1 membrane protein insertion efficiency factor YidD [Desulfotomaculum copahuensis]